MYRCYRLLYRKGREGDRKAAVVMQVIDDCVEGLGAYCYLHSTISYSVADCVLC